MDDEEDVLELGSRRQPRSVVTRLLIAIAVVCAVGGYFVVHGRGHPGERRTALPRSSAPVVSSAPVGQPTPFVPSPSPSLPPWPQVAGACGSSAFVPIVSAVPLAQRTGVRVVVGDRLSTVDVDSATVTPRADLPAGVYATELAAAGGSTYASLIRCRPGGGATSTIVRLDAGGGLHTIARGSYSDLLSGGNHPWGVIYHDDGTTSLDPLDGGAQVPVSAAFDPVAGYGNDIVGAATVLSHSSSEGPQQVQVIEPRNGKVVKVLGEALSMAVSRGVVLWTGATCPQDQCPLLAYDLAAGRRVPVTASLPKDSGLWAAVLSPDRRSLVYVRQQSGPSHYDMGHPGNPNEIAVVDLATGRTVAVPDVELWSKSSPGLAYSTDSHWLVMSFDAGSSVRLLLWEPGLEHALEPSVTVAGKVAFPPGLAALG